MQLALVKGRKGFYPWCCASSWVTGFVLLDFATEFSLPVRWWEPFPSRGDISNGHDDRNDRAGSPLAAYVAIVVIDSSEETIGNEDWFRL